MPRYNRYTVIYLICKTICSIINYNYILQISVCKYSQIFYIYSFNVDTVITKQSMMNQLPTRVQLIKYYISIARMTSSKNHHLKILVCLYQAFYCEGSNVDASVYCFTCRKGDWYDQVWIRCFYIFSAMHQRFIQVKDQGSHVFVA